MNRQLGFKGFSYGNLWKLNRKPENVYRSFVKILGREVMKVSREERLQYRVFLRFKLLIKKSILLN